MKDENSILYVQTTDQPGETIFSACACTDRENDGYHPMVYYLGTGLKILMPGVAENIKLGTFPSVAEMLKKTLDMGIDDLCMRSIKADASGLRKSS